MLPLYASRAHVWTSCAASTRFESNMPRDNDDNDARREGTCASWVAETIINGDANTVDDMLGKVHRNGWAVDAEMALHIDRYLHLLQPVDGCAEVRSTALNGRIVSRSDYVDLRGDTLRVVDLKYGQRVVEHVDNPQLLTEAACFLHAPWKHAELTIYQPRSAHPDGPWRTHTVTRQQVEDWLAQISYTLGDILAEQPIARPGNQCQDCAAAATCHALGASAYAMHDALTDHRQFDMTADQLSAELDFLERAEKLIAARANAVRAEAEARITAGAVVSGWAMKSGRGQRVWKYAPEALRLLLGVDIMRQVPRTPADVEREGINVDAFTTRPTTRAKLARFTTADVERAFNRRR